MGRINMTDWQQITLQEKFRKKKQKSFSLSRLLVVSFIIIFTTSLFFLNVESQELKSSSEISPGFLTRSISFE
jgi:hypothetical protein